MLLNLRIKNFRSFKDEVVFSMMAGESSVWESHLIHYEYPDGAGADRILPAAAIYGANASGKSNLMQAVSSLFIDFMSAGKPKLGERISVYNPFRFDVAARDQPIWLQIEFVENGKKYLYEIEFDDTQILTENLSYWSDEKFKPLVVRERPTDILQRIHKGKITSPTKDLNVEIFQNQPLILRFGDDLPDALISDAFLFLTKKILVINPADDGHMNILYSMASKALNDLDFRKKLDTLVEFADQFFQGFEAKDPNNGGKFVGDFVKVKHKIFDKGVEIGWDTLGLDDESSGTRRLFGLGGLVLAALEMGFVLFVDELESSLHPFISKMLVSAFQNKSINTSNAQLIFTTHQSNLLDRRLLRRDQIWFMEKDKVGSSTMFSLADFDDIGDEMDFEKIYLAGRLGAIPNLNSLESLYVD